MPATIINRCPQLRQAVLPRLKKVADRLLAAHHQPGRHVSFVLVSDQEIQTLNRTYRNKDSATNVLSFSNDAQNDPMLAVTGSHELGEVIISVETARREAIELNQPFLLYLVRLMVHGFVHLIGYDHERSPSAAQEMTAMEKKLLSTSITSFGRSHMINLAINVDHVATIRQARLGREPDPVIAAAQCELAGAVGIVVHLREDRRHIQDRDVRILRETIQTKLNLEMAATDEMLAIALDIKPDMVTLVPEKREELTTEGGLDVASFTDSLDRAIGELQDSEIPVSLFIDPLESQIEAADDVGATFVELHTGTYADAQGDDEREEELDRIVEAAATAFDFGLRVNAGHGLNYVNVGPIAAIEEIEELSIGHAIICRALYVGIDQAVREMREQIGYGMEL